MTLIQVRDGRNSVVLELETADPAGVRMGSLVSTEDGVATAWLERDGEILDSVELVTTTQPRGLHRVDVT